MASKTKPKKLTLRQEARSESTSIERLAQLAEQSTALARLVARNPKASGPLLKKLGSHSDAAVRKWVTGHPNTPPEVLVRLASQFPEQLLDNVAFDILLLENPNLLDDLPKATRRSLLKREKCPVSFLEWLAQDDDEGVQLALAMNPNTPAHILSRLAESASNKVARAASHHVNFPESASCVLSELRIELADEDLADFEATQAWWYFKSPEQYLEDCQKLLPWLVAYGNGLEEPARSLSEWVRAKMLALPSARNPHTDPDSLRKLAASRLTAVLSAVASNRGSPADVLTKLARHEDSEIRQGVAKNQSAPASVLRRLATDMKTSIRAAVAKNPMTPSKVLRTLSEDKQRKVRAAVAANRAASCDLLDRLAADPEGGVRNEVAINPSASPGTLSRLAEDEKSNWVRRGLARNRRTPTETLTQLASGRDAWVRYYVAANRNASAEVLTRLAADRDAWVRSYVAANRNASAEVLTRLAADRGPSVRDAVAMNRSTPASVLARLVKDSEDFIAESAAQNPNTRLRDVVFVAHRRYWDYEEWEDDMRDALAKHSERFAEEKDCAEGNNSQVLQHLAKSEFVHIREIVAGNLNTPRQALKRLATDDETEVAEVANETLAVRAVLLDPSAPPSALEGLVEGPRYLAAMNPSTPTWTLRLLAADSLFRVRETVAENTSTPKEILAQLAADKDYDVLCGVARNPSTPLHILDRLATHPDADFATLAKRAAQRKRDSRRGATAEEADVHAPKILSEKDLDALLAGLPGIAHKLSAKYVDHRRVKVRRRLASNPMLPPDIANRLAVDSAATVRRELAANPGVADEVLESLVADEDTVVAKRARSEQRKRARKEHGPKRRTGVAKPRPRKLAPPRPKPFPVRIQADFSKLNDWMHLARLAPDELDRAIRLEGIPENKRKAMRKALAESFVVKHGRSTRPSLKRLACLLIPDCPVPVLAKAGRSADWKERLAIACHPKTPPAIRQRLANDGNRFVRAAAQQTIEKGV